jgi:hypothetical protein
VDVSSGSKCHSGRNVGGRNVKASYSTSLNLMSDWKERNSSRQDKCKSMGL